MAHTPGPWKRTSGFVAAGSRVVCSMARANSVMHFAAEPGTLEDAANAHLIAAAPELLEYAASLLVAAENNRDMLAICPGIINSLRAAIAKARGQP